MSPGCKYIGESTQMAAIHERRSSRIMYDGAFSQLMLWHSITRFHHFSQCKIILHVLSMVLGKNGVYNVIKGTRGGPACCLDTFAIFFLLLGHTLLIIRYVFPPILEKGARPNNKMIGQS